MKSLIKNIALSTLVTLLAVSPAFAAEQTGNSGLLSWLFLGFCGLVVVGQLIPACVMAFGIAKGVFSPADANQHG